MSTAVQNPLWASVDNHRERCDLNRTLQATYASEMAIDCHWYGIQARIRCIDKSITWEEYHFDALAVRTNRWRAGPGSKGDGWPLAQSSKPA
jgi:hypothetical protein